MNKLPATLIRGDSYYLMDGSYGTYSFTTANSGTTLITIKKATASDHCTDVGWNTATMGASQAGFGSGSDSWQTTGASGYYVVDGNGSSAGIGCGTANGSGTPDCGIKVTGTCASGSCKPIDIGGSNITFRYVEVVGAGAAKTGTVDEHDFYLGDAGSISLSHVYDHDSACDFWQSYNSSNTVIEYSYFQRNNTSGFCHGQALWDNRSSNVTIRYNYFQDIQGTAVITVASAGQPGPSDNWKIYGNSMWVSPTPPTGFQCLGNGVTACINTGETCTNWSVVQNTIAGYPPNNTGGGPTGCGSSQAGIYNEGSGSSYTIQNNLWYGNSSGNDLTWAGATRTENHNSWLNSGSPLGAGGTADITDLSASNPFVSIAAGNFRLVSNGTDWSNGATLASPFNIDPDGNSRPGSDSVWSRGAFEFASAPGPALTLSPSSLDFGNVVVSTTAAQQDFTVTNTGTASATISSIADSGTNASDFAETHTCGTLPATLTASSSCTIHVTLTPAATGVRSATVQVADTPDSLSASGTVSGTGTSNVPVLQVAPSVLSFSSPNVGISSATQAFTVSNTGPAAGTISSIGFTGANVGDFSQTNTCGTLPAAIASGGSCTVTVTFTPSGLGTRTASLTVTDTPDSVSAAGAVSGVAGSAAYRSSSSTTYGARTNTTVTAPAGIQNGDIVLLFTAVGGATPPTPTPPVGFTGLSGFPKSVTAGGFTVANYCWFKVAGSSEPSSYTVTHSSASTQAYMVAISGANTALTPTATTNSGTGSTTSALSITTTASNSLVVFVSQDWGDSANALVAPTGTTPTFTERFSGGILSAADGLLATPGATGAKSISNNNTVLSNPWSGYLIDVEAAALVIAGKGGGLGGSCTISGSASLN